LAYEAYGQPNADKSNAILILHALTGDAHAAGVYGPDDKKPGWWDSLIGPGKAFDTDKYWVICSNVIAGCKGSTGPSSINPATGRPYGIDFPIVTVGDMVEAQRYLMDHLGIRRWYSMAGGSMGGFQVLEWVLRYPDRVRSAMCIASASRVSAQAIAFNAVGRHAIITDPLWENGAYAESGHEGPARSLAIARMMAHITYLSEESLDAKFGRQLQSAETYRYDLQTEFAVESYLEYQGRQFIERFDANTYLYITKAMDYFDLTRQYGPLATAMAAVQAKMLLVAYTSDWLFPTIESKKIARALMQNDKDVSFVEIDSPYGHDAFLLETEQMTRIISSFLQHAALENHGGNHAPLLKESVI
jgi:homoserine O-acetyltransferase